MENFEKKNVNEAICDNELENVAGGMTHIQMDSFGATFQTPAIGCRVRVINGKSCLSCGGTIGKIAMGSASSGVPCEKCNTLILEAYSSDDIEII